MMFGLINLHKPPEFTSHDCVAKLRKLLNTRRIGHGGTLDPSATGVLPIAVGKATRLLQFLPESKAYRARIRLGVATTTDDLEGEVIEQVDRVRLEPSQIRASLNSFVGTIEQVPPIYSAIKKNGKKLYELARKGEEVVAEPRTVTIAKIELLKIHQAEFCELEVDVYCSSGTYIRSIARDVGKQLGVGGTLANLVRTASCGMNLSDSVSFADIERQLQEQTFKLIEPSLLLSHLDTAVLNEDDSQKWCQGQLVDLSQAISTNREITMFTAEHYLVTYSSSNTFLGISILYELRQVLKLKPKIVLAQ